MTYLLVSVVVNDEHGFKSLESNKQVNFIVFDSAQFFLFFEDSCRSVCICGDGVLYTVVIHFLFSDIKSHDGYINKKHPSDLITHKSLQDSTDVNCSR